MMNRNWAHDDWEAPAGDASEESLDRVSAPRLRVAGKRLMAASVAALTVGGAIKKLADPWIPNVQLADVLPVLIIIWVTGGLGVTCAFFAWCRSPADDSRLEQDCGELQRIRKPIQWGVTGVLVLLAIGAVVMPCVDEPTPRSTRVVAGWCLFTYATFGIFLLTRYEQGRHRVVTTYLNVFGVGLGLLFIPCAWLLMVCFQRSHLYCPTRCSGVR